MGLKYQYKSSSVRYLQTISANALNRDFCWIKTISFQGNEFLFYAEKNVNRKMVVYSDVSLSDRMIILGEIFWLIKRFSDAVFLKKTI